MDPNMSDDEMISKLLEGTAATGTPAEIMEKVEEMKRLTEVAKEQSDGVQRLKHAFVESMQNKEDNVTTAQINERAHELEAKLRALADVTQRKADLSREVRKAFTDIRVAHEKEHPGKKKKKATPSSAAVAPTIVAATPSASTPTKQPRRWKQMCTRSVQKSQPEEDDDDVDEDVVSSTVPDKEPSTSSAVVEQKKKKKKSELEKLLAAIPKVVEKKKEEESKEGNQDDGDQDEDEKFYCWCQLEQNDEMINCDYSKCEFEWFHFKCIGLIDAPEGDWYCSDNCKAQGEAEKAVRQGEAVVKKPRRKSKGSRRHSKKKEDEEPVAEIQPDAS